jgi:Carboxypeptidase regulatory-like domain
MRQSGSRGHPHIPNALETDMTGKCKLIQKILVSSTSCQRVLILIWLTIALTAIATAPARAQVLYGTLVGSVTDQTGSVVPGAAVNITNTATGVNRSAKTNDVGDYQFTYLVAGLYTVSVTVPSFRKVISEPISVQTNATRRFDVKLQPAVVGQTVTVTGAAPILQTDRADVSFELSSSQLQALPVALSSGLSAGMRLAQAPLVIVPGITSPRAANSEAGNPSDTLQLNANGVTNIGNAVRIDGVNATYQYLPAEPAYTPSVDAIQSIDAVTNSYDAEEGMAAGSITHITTKSGTNEFHGVAWEYNMISALQAKNYFVPPTYRIPKFVLNQFGLNFGGRIIRDKAFFFSNWEGTRRSTASSAFQTIATDAMRSGNFQGTGTIIYDPMTGNPDGTGRTPFLNNTIPPARISYAAQQMIALLPEPNIQTSALANNYFVSPPVQYRRDTIDSRLDYNPTSKSTTFLRYGIQPSNIFAAQYLGKAGGDANGQPGNAPSLIQSLAFGGTYTFTPNLLLDGNVGFMRVNVAAYNTDLNQNYGLDYLKIPGTNGPTHLDGGYPGFTFSGLSNLGNANGSNPFYFHDNTYSSAENLTWVHGRHSLRFGMEYLHFATNKFQPNNLVGPRGGFAFNGGLTALNGGASPNGYNSWADFLLGLPTQTAKDTQFFTPATMRESVWAFYARDRWQLTRALTVDYGLRYERYPMATRDHGGPIIYNPADGYAYFGGINGVPKNAGVQTGNGQLAPRLGIAYRISPKTVVRAGYGTTIDSDNFRFFVTAYPAIITQQIVGLNSFATSGSLSSVGIPPVVLPDISSGKLLVPPNISTITYALNFRRGYIESYNLTLEREIVSNLTVQAAYIGDHTIRAIRNYNLNYAAPGGGQAGRVLYKQAGTASISSYTPSGTGTYNGLQVSLRKRYSNGAAVGLSYTYSKAISDLPGGSDSGLAVNYPPDSYFNRAVDSFNQTHNLQIYGNYHLPFGKGHNLVSKGFGGWLASGWELDFLLSRTSGTPFTVSSSGASLNAPGNSQFANQLVKKVQILGGHDATHPYFNPDNFAPVTTVSFGNAGLNSVRGPGSFNLNTGLARTFSLTERFKLQFRGEAFNFTNTPTFNNPGANASSRTSSSLNGFGIISSALNPRTMRISARLNF